MNILYRCDQCTHEEWREEGQEPWLCVVCGYMRWEAIASEAEVSVEITRGSGAEEDGD
jgi:uncharacterized Zn finger protein